MALGAIKARVLFEKYVKNKHLCRSDKNLYYLSKLNVPVINLVAGFSDMITKFSMNVYERLFFWQVLKNQQFWLNLSVFYNQ